MHAARLRLLVVARAVTLRKLLIVSLICRLRIYVWVMSLVREGGDCSVRIPCVTACGLRLASVCVDAPLLAAIIE